MLVSSLPDSLLHYPRRAPYAATSAQVQSISVGDIEVAFLPDGVIHTEPGKAFPGAVDQFMRSSLECLDPAGLMVLSVGSVLIRTPESTCLVDLGIGPRRIEIGLPGSRPSVLTGGSLLLSMAAVGADPAEIQHIFFSHLHADHVGWLTDGDGRPTFARAQYWVGEREFDFWASDAGQTHQTAPTPSQLAVLDSNRHDLADGLDVVRGVRAVAMSGHTAAHFGFQVSSPGHPPVVILGDAVHVPAEFTEPGLQWVGDEDPALATSTRRALLAQFPDPGTVFVGPHFPTNVFLERRALES